MSRRSTRIAAGCVAFCLGFGAGCSNPPETGWDAVRNPILGFPDVAIKDAFLVEHEGTWHLGYSQIQAEPFRFRLGFSSSPDLQTFERGPTLDQSETGGLASPSVVKAPDGRYVMTYNSHTRDVEGVLNKLYYRTSLDLTSWSEPHRIHVEGVDAAEDRVIDAALAFADVGAFLFFKREQRANLAYSASGSIDGPWTHLGELQPGNLENCQPILIDGQWHMLGTEIPLLHRPVLHRLEGDERDPAAWLTWSLIGELEIEPQSWNDGPFLDHETANAAFLVDRRAEDGYFHLLYAGSTEVTSFNARGHSSLGLSRSRDLKTWEPARAR